MTSDSQRGPVTRPALSRCIRVSSDEFATDNWGRAPLLSRSAELATGFGDLFSADAVDTLVSERGLRTPFLRMAKEGTVLPPSSFTGSGGFGAEVADQVDSAKVLDEFASGSTIVLQGLHRTWAPLIDFTRQLTTDVGHPCQVNAYVTPASSRGFDPHYDVHDVFVIQISGEKHWMIHEPVHPDPLRGQPWTDHRAAVADRAAGSATIDETMRPGDVLYLPRGWIHSATALGGTSIHLTIGMAALTRYDAVEQLVTALAADPAMRASLPLGTGSVDPAELTALVRSVASDAAARLAASPADTVAERLVRRVRDSSRPAGVRPLATVDALTDIDASTVVRWRSGVAPQLVDADTGVSVIRASTTVTLPSEASSALHALADGAPRPVGELPRLDTASAIVVARRLVREGILVIG